MKEFKTTRTKGMRNVPLEISTGESLIGTRVIGGNTARDIYEGSHQTLVDNLIKYFNGVPEMEAGTSSLYKGEQNSYPDVVIDLRELGSVHDWVALEVKCDRNDLKRSTYQCRTYYLNGLSPYITIPMGLFNDTRSILEDIYSKTPTNLPGILIVNGGSTIVSCKPNYE